MLNLEELDRVAEGEKLAKLWGGYDCSKDFAHVRPGTAIGKILLCLAVAHSNAQEAYEEGTGSADQDTQARRRWMTAKLFYDELEDSIRSDCGNSEKTDDEKIDDAYTHTIGRVNENLYEYKNLPTDTLKELTALADELAFFFRAESDIHFKDIDL